MAYWFDAEDVEVLSDSTEAFDEGKNSDDKNIQELEEYVLVHQKQILVERFWRKASGLWLTQTYRVGENVALTSIGFTCPIDFLYEKAEQFLEDQR